MSSDVFAWGAGMLGIAGVLVLGRFIAGPTVPDRVVALDALNTLAVAIMVALSVVYDSVIFVDVAIVYAALSFVGTLFIARYIEGRRPR